MNAFDTPILLLVFNRPVETKKVFEAIRQARPKQLFVAADGPRANKLGEKEKCDIVRDIATAIDWDCKLKTLFRDDNLGCGKAVSQAISWFFEQVEEGIILEDDCLPDLSFFLFCNELLVKYRYHQEIMHISGNSFYNQKRTASYYYSKFPFIWGWATWKRAWKHYDFYYHGDSNQERNTVINKTFKSVAIQNYWKDVFHQHLITNLNLTWDYQWFYSTWKNNGKVILPSKNLVSNIGFGTDATHTKDAGHRLYQYKTGKISFPLKDPVNNEIAQQSEDGNFYNFYSKIPTKLMRIKKSFIGIISKIIKSILFRFVPESRVLFSNTVNWNYNVITGSIFSDKVKFYAPYSITNVKIGDYTYIAQNSLISNTEIGKFCSIGPNFFCGWGIHPTNGLSTNPMFYSTRQQNGFSISYMTKIDERKMIKIGNDVFIGANVTVLDGIEIGDGAVIGAGAIVSKNIPPYAIAVGAPIRIINKRFDDEKIEDLLKIKWWNWNEAELKNVEQHFFDIDSFIQKFKNKNELH